MGFDAADNDQPVGVGVEDCVATTLGGKPPVGCKVVGPPGCRSMRLIVKIGANDHRIAAIPVGKHHPVGNPAFLADLGIIPQLGLAGGGRAVAVEHDPHATLPGPGDERVEQLDRTQPLQVGVLVIVDAVRANPGF